MEAEGETFVFFELLYKVEITVPKVPDWNHPLLRKDLTASWGPGDVESRDSVNLFSSPSYTGYHPPRTGLDPPTQT